MEELKNIEKAFKNFSEYFDGIIENSKKSVKNKED